MFKNFLNVTDKSLSLSSVNFLAGSHQLSSKVDCLFDTYSSSHASLRKEAWQLSYILVGLSA